MWNALLRKSSVGDKERFMLKVTILIDGRIKPIKGEGKLIARALFFLEWSSSFINERNVGGY